MWTHLPKVTQQFHRETGIYVQVYLLQRAILSSTKKAASEKLGDILANSSAPAPEASQGMCVHEGQSARWQLSDKQARTCQDVCRKPSPLKAEVWLGWGGGRTWGCTFSPAQQAVGFLPPS